MNKNILYEKIENLVCDEASYDNEDLFEQMLMLYHVMDDDQKKCFKAFMKLKQAKKEQEIIKQMQVLKKSNDELIRKIKLSLDYLNKSNSNLESINKGIKENSDDVKFNMLTM